MKELSTISDKRTSVLGYCEVLTLYVNIGLSLIAILI